jgi:phosphoribosyl-AMP cyclohydrolase
MELDFKKLDGLIPAVIQDHKTGRVLMLGFMNEEAFRKTVDSGFATFFSRSRNKLWLKGESSGHRLVVKSISTDCDQDAVLVEVEASGRACVTRAIRAVSSASSRTASGRTCEERATIRNPSTAARHEAQTRHS